VELNGEDLSCCSNEIESVSSRRCLYDHRFTIEAYLSVVTVTNISKSFYLQDGGKINWRRYGTKLRLCHSMCSTKRSTGNGTKTNTSELNSEKTINWTIGRTFILVTVYFYSFCLYLRMYSFCFYLCLYCCFLLPEAYTEGDMEIQPPLKSGKSIRFSVSQIVA